MVGVPGAREGKEERETQVSVTGDGRERTNEWSVRWVDGGEGWRAGVW